MSPEAGIVGYCRECGKALEETNSITAEGSLYCAEHAPPARVQTPLSEESLPPYTATPFHAGSSPYNAIQPPPLPKAVSHVSPPLAFVLGFIPGVGAVYNAQYAKGLVHVVIFGSIISLLSSGAARGFEPLFGLMIPTFVFYMAFEAYHTAKKLREGEMVDEFSGLARVGTVRSRLPVGPVLLVALGILFLLNNFEILQIGMLLRRYWPAGLIVLGLYLLYDRITETKNER